MKKFNGSPATILLVEDNEGDARLAKEALKDGKINNELHHVKDGVEAMQYLKREGAFNADNAPRPDIILLDLNMPRMDGRETLEAINQIPNLASIPIIILTTSQNEEDIVRSYDLNANCFITKPVDFDQFIYMVHSIKEFWLTVVSLPHVKED